MIPNSTFFFSPSLPLLPVNRVLTELVSKMKDMQMDKSELGCLRAIVLFNPGDVCLSPAMGGGVSPLSRLTSGALICSPPPSSSAETEQSELRTYQAIESSLHCLSSLELSWKYFSWVWSFIGWGQLRKMRRTSELDVGYGRVTGIIDISGVVHSPELLQT